MATITAVPFSVFAFVVLAKKAVNDRKVAELLAVKKQLVTALENPDVPSSYKRRPDGQIRLMLGEIQRVLNDLNDQEVLRFIWRIEVAQQRAEMAVTYERQRIIERIVAVRAAIQTIQDAYNHFSSHGYLIPALGRVKLSNGERGWKAMNELVGLRQALGQKMRGLQGSVQYEKDVKSAKALLEAAKATGNTGAVKAHMRTLIELGVAT